MCKLGSNFLGFLYHFVWFCMFLRSFLSFLVIILIGKVRKNVCFLGWRTKEGWCESFSCQAGVLVLYMYLFFYGGLQSSSRFVKTWSLWVWILEILDNLEKLWSEFALTWIANRIEIVEGLLAGVSEREGNKSIRLFQLVRKLCLEFIGVRYWSWENFESET